MKKGDKMDFKTFIGKLAPVIQGKQKVGPFIKDVLEHIITDEKDLRAEGLHKLEMYSLDTYKKINSSPEKIRGIAKEIGNCLDYQVFQKYIEKVSGGALENLCKAFADDIQDIDQNNASEKIALLLNDILTTAASSNVIQNQNTYQPSQKINSFEVYLKKAKDHYLEIKTLLYSQKPQNFFDIYVCNNIAYQDDITSQPIILKNATITSLESVSNHLIIQGKGGMGKSMFMLHLFLSAVNGAEKTGVFPVLIFLKNYSKNCGSLFSFIANAIREFDPRISNDAINELLTRQRLVILLDGLDEIKANAIEHFEQELCSFVKNWTDTTLIITSRPIDQFISYAKFQICALQPFEENQAVELINRLQITNLEIKNKFISELRAGAYNSYKEFASSPLLLQILFMSYSKMGNIPAKKYKFYESAYETMLTKHDNSKGLFVRKLYTKLSLDDFSSYFAKFCAITYKEHIFDFDKKQFCYYMKKATKNTALECSNITSDFLKDLTVNLCIMHQEGEKYLFIHRSFQEYFTAVYFSSLSDNRLKNVADFIDSKRHYYHFHDHDNILEMLYDMIPQRVERYIFFPFLEKLFGCCELDKSIDYFNFLQKLYQVFFVCAHKDGCLLNSPSSSVYKKLLSVLTSKKKLHNYLLSNHIDKTSFIDFKLQGIPKENIVIGGKKILGGKSLNESPRNLEWSNFCDKFPEKVCNADEDHIRDVTVLYDFCAYVNSSGFSIRIPYILLKEYSEKYKLIKNSMEKDSFTFRKEYYLVREYYEELKMLVQEDNDLGLFD